MNPEDKILVQFMPVDSGCQMFQRWFPAMEGEDLYDILSSAILWFLDNVQPQGRGYRRGKVFCDISMYDIQIGPSLGLGEN